MNTLEKSQSEYLKIHQAIKKIEDKIELRVAQIERLEKRRSKLWATSYWTENLLRPIVEEIKSKFPQIKWDDERLTPMGICARVSIFGGIGGETVSIAFTPFDLENGVLAYDTGELKSPYPEGSLGDLNGFDKVAEPITSLEQVFDHIQKQL